jgi:hypothetical protein
VILPNKGLVTSLTGSPLPARLKALAKSPRTTTFTNRFKMPEDHWTTLVDHLW